MIADALSELLNGLDELALKALKGDILLILAGRLERATADQVIDFEEMSSLELYGLVAMIEVRLRRPPSALLQ